VVVAQSLGDMAQKSSSEVLGFTHPPKRGVAMDMIGDCGFVSPVLCCSYVCAISTSR